MLLKFLSTENTFRKTKLFCVVLDKHKASGSLLRSLGVLLTGAFQSYRDLALERNGELQAFCLRDAVETHFSWGYTNLAGEQKPKSKKDLSLIERCTEKNDVWCSRQPAAFLQ